MKLVRLAQLWRSPQLEVQTRAGQTYPDVTTAPLATCGWAGCDKDIWRHFPSKIDTIKFFGGYIITHFGGWLHNIVAITIAKSANKKGKKLIIRPNDASYQKGRKRIQRFQFSPYEENGASARHPVCIKLISFYWNSCYDRTIQITAKGTNNESSPNKRRTSHQREFLGLESSTKY